jgi:hypothetical protein
MGPLTDLVRIQKVDMHLFIVENDTLRSSLFARDSFRYQG